MPAEDQYSGLNVIIGEQLSAVTFVADYLQLWFDGPGINVTAPMTVTSGAMRVVSWDEGFRDLLCDQIFKRVVEVERIAGERLTLTFEDDSALSVSLRPDDKTSVESYYAHHLGDGRGWYVE